MRARQWLIGAAVLLVAVATLAPGVSAQGKPDKVTIGYQVVPNGEIVAKGLGWHEKAMGVKIEWRQFDSGRDVNTAMAAGAIDIGLVGSSAVANGLASGVPYEVIWIYDVIADNEALVARKGKGITGIKDLVGKKVVVVANLEPATIMGVESNGMVLAGSAEGTLAVLTLDRDLPPGSKVR